MQVRKAASAIRDICDHTRRSRTVHDGDQLRMPCSVREWGRTPLKIPDRPADKPKAGNKTARFHEDGGGGNDFVIIDNRERSVTDAAI